MLASVAKESFVDAFERYMGDNDLLPVNYLEIGFQKSKSIGRLTYFDLEANEPAVATGFLISPDLVMTNRHVFPEVNLFRDAQVEFNYQYNIHGKEARKIIFELKPDKFFYSNQELDFAVIGIHSKDTSGKVDVLQMGYLVLNKEPGKAGEGDFASIIQHPDGKLKQIALRENKIVDISLPDALIYMSDTSRGSSGSPVFNDQWQVIALHSAGVPKKDDQGNFLDKDNNIIQPANGKVDGDRIVWLNNRGIRISAIINHLFSENKTKDHPLILQLASPTYSDDKRLDFLSLPGEAAPEEKAVAPAAAAVPGAAAAEPQHVYININLGNKSAPVISPGIVAKAAVPADLEFEKKIEDEIDFSGFKGFDEFFLTEKTPLPDLSDGLKKKVAKFLDGSKQYVLKYPHFSTVHHAIRRMPVYSAINIYGHENRFPELTGRNDNWFRDRRIDFDVQLTEDFYKKSGFDKGHMSRREDAEWSPDNNIDFAEMAANMTCAYTNACPQVPALNRARFGGRGLWGKLEQEILEKGVVKEDGRAGKICVFNGPIFDKDDPHFKGIQVPMEFWKVVVWKNKLGRPRTTCFKLSQEDLVSDIEFEELRFDKIFRNYQCSIEFIEDATGLTFTRIRDWDTYDDSVDNSTERLLEDTSFERLIELNQ
jgi:endonuclease G, mitochondrial